MGNKVWRYLNNKNESSTIACQYCGCLCESYVRRSIHERNCPHNPKNKVSFEK